MRGCPTAGKSGDRKKPLLLALGVAVNLLLLGYFKYRNFMVVTVSMALGFQAHLAPLVLPLAISFFTFEQITYLVAAYRDEIEEHDFLNYLLFITFFPHLIAGPIVRYNDIVPQLNRNSRFILSAENLSAGLMIFAIGLFKKVIIADAFRGLVADVFDSNAAISLVDAWGATLAFTVQIYFDFSGYSDMAIGLARMFNVRFPENFDSPYQADSIIEFWRRWHMTLSSFLRDYLYIPLGGNRLGEVRRYANLFVTMLLGGLWHGASWTFVIWGAAHGIFLSINHLWRRLGIALPRAIAWLLTFLAVVVAWALFRAPSFHRAQEILASMAGLNGISTQSAFHWLGGRKLRRLVPVLGIVLLAPNRQAIMRWQWEKDYLYASAFALLAGISILCMANPPPFIYFQF
jgi:alginate O-acetyltransferase complex protein AlgI